MKLLLALGLLPLLLHDVVSPPVTSKKPGVPHNDEPEPNEDLSDYMEYHRYLQEVVQALESDPEFREKLTKAEEVDIRTGKIAHELEYVNHNVRTKLDELKRQELERLRHLATKQFELSNDIDTDHLKIKEHLDHTNEHTFEVEDLKKLILKTTADLAEADKKRRQEFKEYEMQKEFEKQEKLKLMDEEHKKEYEKQLHEQEKKHKKHKPLHHPGSKQQLEEVWEKQDHMDSQNFDPRTFFMLHDLDGNGVWDQDEVKALFLKELDKLYQAGTPEDDMRERAEEMERMREHVFAEADTNRDGLLSFQEFLSQTKKEEFQRDQGWETLDQQKFYTPEEYQEFERHRQQEIQKMIQQGMLPPNPYGHPYGQMPPQGQFPPQGHPNYQNMQPNQMQYAQQMNQNQQQMNQVYNQAQQRAPQPGMNNVPNQGNQQMNNMGNPNAIPHQGQQQMNNIGNPNAIPNQGQQQMNNMGNPKAIPNQGQQQMNNMGNPNAIPNQGQQQTNNMGDPNAIPNPGQEQMNNVVNANNVPNQGSQGQQTNIADKQEMNKVHQANVIGDTSGTPNQGMNHIGKQVPKVDNTLQRNVPQNSNEHVASINMNHAANEV